ncbi:MAG: hypothetical protein ACON4K_13100 [Akkermansiaceae bacterium]
MFVVRSLLIFIAFSATAGAVSPRKQVDFELIVAESGWNYSPKKLHRIFKQAGGVLWRNFPEAELPAVEVSYQKNGPFVFFDVNERGHKRIQLSSQGSYWSQHVYQFAHEFCHLLVDCKKGDRSNHWFEESVCEMASVYVVGELAKEWKTNPAISGAESYAQSFARYAEELKSRESYQLPKEESFQTWFGKHEAILGKSDGYQRDLNGVVALKLLPLLQNTPTNWGAFRFINVQRKKNAVSFEGYLRSWKASSPEKYHHFIAQIAIEFGKEV